MGNNFCHGPKLLIYGLFQKGRVLAQDGVEQHRIDHGKDSGVGADAEREGDDREPGKEWALHEGCAERE